MPVNPTYPGVYIEELPSGVNTIVGVSTSITAFVGRALKGSVDEPVMVQSFAEFERTFGGLWEGSTMSYAVSHYFMNGGRDAVIVRVEDGSQYASAKIAIPAGEVVSGGLKFTSILPGNATHFISFDKAKNTLEIKNAKEDTVPLELYTSFSFDPDAWNNIYDLINEKSELVRCEIDEDSKVKKAENTMSSGNVGLITTQDLIGKPGDKTGMYALEQCDIFNILCIPPPKIDSNDLYSIYPEAAAYCEKRRAILLVDPRPGWNHSQARDAAEIDNIRNKNSAIYFPMLKVPDPLSNNELIEFPPCGAVAGVLARTDATRGIWKSPAGIRARLRGAQGLSVKLTDGENGQLNPLGINCLRNFPVIGNVVWGARTLDGADIQSSDWKYLSVRRMALYIEESLYRGSQWVVFEPNDEPLWARICLSVGSFMNGLFRKGAFQGSTPKDAYFVRCDKDTTTQDDINKGIVNILVGFAPLKPAEFVIIKLQQIAGKILV